MKFEASQVTPTQFSTAADKAKFANHFVRFVESGFKITLFPKWFYHQLSNTFGHIAHFNQGGFYDVQCSTARAQHSFLRQCAGYGCFGSPEFTYCDVEHVLAKWIRDSGRIEVLVTAIRLGAEAAERNELARLKAKYEVSQ